MFSQEFIERVRDASNIVEVISQHTELKRGGSALLGLCPFPMHKEKTPSFSVSDTKQVYYCFGCGRSGNVFSFLRDCRGLTFPEAVTFLADRAGIPLPVTNEKSDEKADQRKRFLSVNRLACLYFHEQFLNLPENHKTKIYAHKRGLTDALVNQFSVGYSPDSWDGLFGFLKNKNQSVADIEALGLIKKRQDSSGHFDIFRDRLMFPIFSVMGDCVGFGGRILGEGQPKYLNSSDSPVFSKGKLFYGLNESAKYIRTEDVAIVVEGYMDFLAVFKVGINNVVATLGTAMTEDHAQILKRYTKNVVLLYDGDEAGQKATLRSLDILLSHGLLPRAVELPNKLDPDEFLEAHGVEKLRQLVKSAPDLYFKKLDELQKKFGSSPTDKVRLIEELSSTLLCAGDERLKDLYFSETAARLGVNVQWLKKATQKSANVTANSHSSEGKASQIPPPALARSVPLGQIPREETMILNLSLWNESLMKRAVGEKVLDQLSHGEIQKILARAMELYGQRSQDFDKLTSILSTEFERVELFTQHLDLRTFNFGQEQGDKFFKDCVDRVKNRRLKEKASALIRDLKVNQDEMKLEQFVNILKDRQADKT